MGMEKFIKNALIFSLLFMSSSSFTEINEEQKLLLEQLPPDQRQRIEDHMLRAQDLKEQTVLL